MQSTCLQPKVYVNISVEISFKRIENKNIIFVFKKETRKLLIFSFLNRIGRSTLKQI